MKKNQKKALLAVGIAGAAILALRNAEAIGDAFGMGSLGGEDDMEQDKPFNFYDPNYNPDGDDAASYDPYAILDPYGPTPPTDPTDPTPGPTPPQTYDDTAAETTGGYDTVSGGYEPAWWDNPLIWGAGMAAGYGAVEGGRKLLGKSKSSKTNKVKSPKSTEVTKGRTKGPKPRVTEKVRTPAATKQAARFKTDVMASNSRTTLGKGGKLKTSEPIGFKPKPRVTSKAKVPAIKGPKMTPKVKGVGKGIKGAGAAGAVLAVGQIGAETTQLWRETNPQNVGEAAGVVGAASGNFLSDSVGFLMGMVYRPGTSNPRYKGQNEGWFASWRDIADLGEYHRSQDVGAGERVLDVLGMGGFINKEEDTEVPGAGTIQGSEQITNLLSASPAERAIQTIASRNVSRSGISSQTPTQPKGGDSNSIMSMINKSKSSSSKSRKSSYSYNPKSKTLKDNKSGLSYSTSGKVSYIGGKPVIIGVRSVSSSKSSSKSSRDSKGRTMTSKQVRNAGKKGSNYAKVTRKGGKVEYHKIR